MNANVRNETIDREVSAEGTKCSGGKNQQYGKKGRKPRTHYTPGNTKMEEIVSNAIAYWNKVVMFNNVTKFTWPLIVGQTFPENKLIPAKWLAANGKTTTKRSYAPPQMMTIDIITGPGWAESVQDGVNRSLAMIMADIRASLSTNQIGFETADLGIFETTTASIPMLLGFARKLILGFNKWNSENYVYPRGFYKMHGFDFDAELQNRQNTIVKFNSLVDMFNNMSIPDFSDVYDRQYALIQNTYLDEDSPYGQIYSFVPHNYYTYDDKNGKGVYHVLNVTTLEQLLNIIQDCINAWYTSSDLFAINGVLKRAFKDNPRLTMEHIDINDTIVPTTDREILMQIMNCSMIPVYDIAPNGDPIDTVCVTQDPADPTYIKWTPTVDRVKLAGAPIVADSFLLRAFEDTLTNDDNMEMTRLLTMVDDSAGTSSAQWPCKRCSSEIVTSITVGRYDIETDAMVTSYKYTSNFVFGDVAGYDSIFDMANFRYIPTIYVLKENGTVQNEINLAGILGDVYNYMLYSRDDYQTLNNVALQSLWVPKKLANR